MGWMELPNIWKVRKFMFQTTNQLHIYLDDFPKKQIDEFLTAKLSKSPDLAIASDERVKRLMFEPFPVIVGL